MTLAQLEKRLAALFLGSCVTCKNHQIYRLLLKAKLRVGTMDLRIAAIALAHDATLVTRAHFRRVPGLRVEDWTRPMPTVWIPPPLRDLTNGQERVDVSQTRNVRQVIEALDRLFPGMKTRLCDENGLKRGIAVAVDTQVANLGLIQPVREDSEVHFLNAVAGG